MAEYLSREDVSRMILKYRADNPKKQTVWAMVISDMLRDLKEIPAADVQPIKHGRWSECYTDSRLYSGICTVCGKASIRSIKENPLEYCPKCGARMDGDS